MSGKRRVLGSGLKAKAALAAVRGDKTMSQLASEHGVHATQIALWKKLLMEHAAELFEDGRKNKAAAAAATNEQELFEQIGRLKMELEWLKKKVARFD